MSRRRCNRDFNNFDDPGFNRPRGLGGPFGFVFSMVALGLTIAFNVVGLVLHIISGIAGSKPVKPHNPEPVMRPQAAPSQNNTAANEELRAQTIAKAQKESKKNVKIEQVKETLNQSKEEHTSDWNILLFVLTLIPVIITLAMKRLDLAGFVLLGGSFVIVTYNLIRNASIAAKKRRQLKQNEKAEEVKEDTEIERVIKEAFNKVFAIRKELFRIQKPEVKAKLEGLCEMAEKIIGEVRENPDKLNSVRKFFYYYLDAFTEVFEKYTKLYTFSGSSEEVQKLLIETEKSFDDMEDIFKEMCEGMLEKDMLNLKATINVLKNSNYSN